MIRELQERAARAIPAEHVEYADGWWLRYAPGCSWWIGTVLPHADGDLEHRIAAAERFYADRRAAARFQIAPGACPPELDALLAERGYRKLSPVLLMTAAPEIVLTRLPGVTADTRPTDHPTADWFAVWHAVSGGDPDAERALLSRVRQLSAYVLAADEAVGRVVQDTQWAGIFGMATLPQARGTGKARAVLAALTGWAATHGARTLYLQVERSNEAALRLYEKAGFTEVTRYHYRARTEPTAAG